MAPKKPWYLPRSDGAKMSPMIASDREQRAGAEALDPTEDEELPHLLAQAHSSKPTRKMLTLIIKIGRRPKKSDSFP